MSSRNSWLDQAQSVAVAEIWLWEVGSWKVVGRLQSHSLTVTKLEFSHDDNFLLAVSRDRQFSVFAIKKYGDEVSHQLITKQEAHKRIIWTCSWNPFCHQFATGSRDKTIKIWAVNRSTSSVKQISSFPAFKDSVTALSWLGLDRSSNTGILAVGMDNGLIELWTVSGGINLSSPFLASVSFRFDPYLSHVSTVHRLAWSSDNAGDWKTVKLASCGGDNCVRVFEVRITKSSPMSTIPLISGLFMTMTLIFAGISNPLIYISFRHSCGPNRGDAGRLVTSCGVRRRTHAGVMSSRALDAVREDTANFSSSLELNGANRSKDCGFGDAEKSDMGISRVIGKEGGKINSH
ncbi:Elongator complex protein 2 [Platanthera guangdongensis]|uniref:Elongator complex protein 2 n=1 Tax=Platanthera guangdongensis TaxID=2320717 RepID=A0ABR2M9L3_9ASPA